MMEGAGAPDTLLDDLVRHVLAWAGHRPDPRHEAAVRRAIREKCRGDLSIEELLERAAHGDPDLMGTLASAVAVPETYFFRQPEQFEWIAEAVCPVLPRGKPVRAWSAGCATGEEAYSLTACLLASLPGGTDIEVLGTDVMPVHVEIARLGVYGSWSRRGTGSNLYPVFRIEHDGRAHVLPEVRERTKFATHNVLHEPPGRFDIVLCRNVLLYFTPEATRTATERLAHALRGSGALVFGTLDLGGVPSGLARAGRPELNAFRADSADERRGRATRRSTCPPRRSTRPPRRSAPPEVGSMALLPVGSLAHVALHMSALGSIERGDRRRAEQELEELRRVAPDYLPGMFEHALLLVRDGNAQQARRAMREVLRRLQSLPPDAILAGPEDLPVQYYRVAARTYLDMSSSTDPAAHATRSRARDGRR